MTCPVTSSVRRRPLAAYVGALAAGLLLLGSGCSLVKDPNASRERADPDAGVTGPVASVSPTSAPLAFDQQDSRRFPEQDVRTVAAAGDVVLTLTASTVTARSLPDLETAYALSAAGGELTDLHLDAARGVGYSLEVATDAGDGTTVGRVLYTVQRFDLRTGEIRDSVTATLPQDPRGSARDATARIASVRGDRAVLDSWVPGAQGPHAVVVVDLADQRRAWQQRPAQVLTTAPGLVVVDTGSPTTPGRVEALDLGSGRRTWSALPGTLGATAIGTTASSVVLARDDEVFPQATITRLRLSDGRAGPPRTTTAWDWSCERSPRRVAVCTLAGGDQGGADRVVGWDLRRDRPAWSLPTADRFAPIVTDVHDGLVYGLLDSGQGVVLDAATGADVAGRTGAAPSAVNDWGGVVLYGGTALFLPATAPDGGSGGDGSGESTASPSAPPTD